ncbi:MAG TPA: hypothetical protein VFP30_01270 [Candidatus Limnocylindria bacterium]|nr:hypothetical protein [Candidatus Limnocylindria bacterium]
MSGHAHAQELLESLRQADGGFAPAPGGISEPEPTALAAIALDDAAARSWLEASQATDGGFTVGPPALRNDTSTALAAIALDGGARELALGYLVGHQAQAQENDPRFPHDPDTRGWGWTSLTFGWTEPTARAVLALKLLRPDAPELEDGLSTLADRESLGGGWNYGNREVLDRNLEPFLQTTAAGLMAVQDGPVDLRDRAIAVVERLWDAERGGLGWAMSLVALQLAGVTDADRAGQLSALVDETELLSDGVALAWAVMALTDRWQRLSVAGS